MHFEPTNADQTILTTSLAPFEAVTVPYLAWSPYADGYSLASDVPKCMSTKPIIENGTLSTTSLALSEILTVLMIAPGISSDDSFHVNDASKSTSSRLVTEEQSLPRTQLALSEVVTVSNLAPSQCPEDSFHVGDASKSTPCHATKKPCPVGMEDADKACVIIKSPQRLLEVAVPHPFQPQNPECLTSFANSGPTCQEQESLMQKTSVNCLDAQSKAVTELQSPEHPLCVVEGSISGDTGPRANIAGEDGLAVTQEDEVPGPLSARQMYGNNEIDHLPAAIPQALGERDLEIDGRTEISDNGSPEDSHSASSPTPRLLSTNQNNCAETELVITGSLQSPIVIVDDDEGIPSDVQTKISRCQIISLVVIQSRIRLMAMICI